MNQVRDNQNEGAHMNEHPIHELNRQVNEQPPSPETVKLIDAMVDACAYAGFNDVAKHLRAAFPKEHPLKPCPFCNVFPAEHPESVRCETMGCPMSYASWVPRGAWQTRKGEA